MELCRFLSFSAATGFSVGTKPIIIESGFVSESRNLVATKRVHALARSSRLLLLPSRCVEGAPRASALRNKMLLLLQRLVHERDRNRSFPNRRGNSFHISRSHVTRGKNTGQTSFQEVRPACERPAGFDEFFLRKFGARLDKALAVEH